MVAVLWDFNGVVVDDEPLHYRAFNEVLTEDGQPLAESQYFGEFLGLDDRGMFRAVLGRQDVEEWVERKSKAYMRLLDGGYTLFEGCEALMRGLHGAAPQAVGSGARRAEIEAILTRSGLRSLISAIVSADDVPRGKPDPMVYRAAAEALGVRPKDCIVIEDAPPGIRAAQAAGARCIAVATSRPAEQLQEADRVVQSLAELSAQDILQF